MHALPGGAGHGRRAGRRRRSATARRVDRILLREGTSGAVTGVRLDDGEVVDADAVVANPDLPVAYRTLLPGLAHAPAARLGHYSPSALVWHVGVRGELPAGTEHHNIHFGGDWDGAFRAILRDGVRMPDPSLLVSVPSLHEPTMAPAGAHALYVLEPVPNLDGRIDWTDVRPRPATTCAATSSASATPPTSTWRSSSTRSTGSDRAWSAARRSRSSHRFRQTGPFRPGNLERRAPGLVFTGSGTVPGVGVPMVLVSGMLAAERVEQMRAR